MTERGRISFADAFRFDAPPDELWAALGQTHLYGSWWRWMRDVRVSGHVPEAGSVVSFRVLAPIPYRMQLRVEIVDAARPGHIAAKIEGDLSGTGTLRFEANGDGTVARVAWDVEVTSRALRPIVQVARPVLVRAQHWAVLVALRGFRRHLREPPR